MEIKWLGHSCFVLRGKEATVVTDPFDPTLGYPQAIPEANIVTVSHEHSHHSFVAAVRGNPRLIKGPGEYEVANIFIYGIRTFHDAERGRRRGKNTAYLMEIDDVRVCHLGDLGHVPTSEQVEELSGTDVLLIPVGGVCTINAAAAAETISLLEPKVVVPMHFRTEAAKIELEPVEHFLKEMGLIKPSPQLELAVTKSSLPEQTKVVLLDYRGTTSP
jgi:L-ascorbate metabolism protein UlaG (beta-lactamase superfamily)